MQNILTRVTGQSISNIDGLIRANGSANLFLINPNGIIFGPNASLNIGGSFVASTASSIQFADGTEFSAVNPSTPPLLTISVPIGLQFNGRQGDILVQGNPEQPFNEVGDAGQLPGTAQTVNSATDGTRFNAISGELNYDNDVDLYQLYLRQGVPFQASTVKGTNVDTQLFLFDSRGRGLFSNDDSSNTYQSALPLNRPFIPAVSGTYYLGISSNFSTPRSPRGNIFAPSEEPNGPGAGLPLSEWTGYRVADRGPYTITLTPQSYFQVRPGKTLTLVGGNVTIERSNLQTLGGRVELGGVASSGSVGLDVNGDRIQLSFPDQVARADVSLRNSGIDVRGANSSMSLVARNIDITRSLLQGGIPSDSRLPGTQTGALELNATGSITVGDSSNLVAAVEGQGMLGNINLTAGERVSIDNATVRNIVLPDGVGNAGNINITTGSLSLTNGGRLSSFTFGRGNVGSLNINARDTVSVDGRNIGGFPSRLSNTVLSPAIGNGGGINITTGSFSVTNGARVNSNTTAQGNAGDITINARDTVLFRNSADLPDSRTQLDTSTFGSGNGGNVNITTGSLFVANGVRLFATTRGSGNAGSVTINARDVVSLDGENPNGAGNSTTFYTQNSTIYTQVNAGAIGPPGEEARFRAVGQGGDVTITTGSLFLTNGGAVNTSTQGQGNAGRVTIVARDAVQIRGAAPSAPDAPSGIVTAATAGSVGNGGDVMIKTNSLSVSDRGRINTNAQGQGNAGNITIRASDAVSFDGGNAITTLESSGLGRGGDIEIAARSLSVLNNAQLAASTFGEGNAGNITISANTLSIQDQANVTVSSASNGRAGSLFVDTDRLFLNNQGSIRADTTGGGGNINVRSPFILLRNGSNITTNARGSNIPGGNIAIDTQFLIAVPKEDSNISANSEDFRGGNVSIKAFSIFGIQPRPTPTPLSDITATGATSTLNGTIDVTLTGIDPTAGLVALPTDLVDASGLIAQGCPANQGNSFVITGRGGLPPTPEQQLDDDAGWGDRRRLTVAQPTEKGRGVRSGGHGDTETWRHGDVSHSRFPDTPHSTPDTPILEATGWQITPTGAVSLVASTSDPTVQNRLNQVVSCQGR